MSLFSADHGFFSVTRGLLYICSRQTEELASLKKTIDKQHLIISFDLSLLYFPLPAKSLSVNIFDSDLSQKILSDEDLLLRKQLITFKSNKQRLVLLKAAHLQSVCSFILLPSQARLVYYCAAFHTRL